MTLTLGTNLGNAMRRFIAWIETRARWNQLKTLGSSSLVRASVLMPAFGYILLLNDNIHQYLTIKYDGWLLHYLPSIWRIWLLFYGSFALALAAILYSAFCPAEVKRYSSAFEMADAERKHQLLLNQFGIEHQLVKTLYARMSKWQRAIFPLDSEAIEKNFGKLTNLDDRMSAALIYHWNIVNIRCPALRLLVLFLFALGLVLLAIPAAFTFAQVSVLFVKRAFA